MFERFTERARAVVLRAQDEAHALNHDHTGTEHLLLALSTEPEYDLSAELLASLGVSPVSVRKQIVTVFELGSNPSPAALPFTSATKRAFEFAIRQAVNLEHTYVGTEHLLLGLMDDPASPAVKILSDVNVDATKVRAAMLKRLTSMGSSGPQIASSSPAERRRPGAAIRVAVDSAGSFRSGPDGELRRAMMAAAARALTDSRSQFGTDDVLAVINAGAPFSTGLTFQSEASFRLSAEPALRRALMSAAARALEDGREQFGTRDLVAVIEAPR